MQVYRRIQNPYMPQGEADLTNAPSFYPHVSMSLTPFYARGEIGCRFSEQSSGHEYHRVILDSGATSATPVGAVAANQLAFWKSRQDYLVTNDKRLAEHAATVNGFVQDVAGIFRVAGTPGYVVDILTGGLNIPVASDGNGSPGFHAIVDTTAGTANITASASATTAPLSKVVGVIHTAPANGVARVDVHVGEFNNY